MFSLPPPLFVFVLVLSSTEDEYSNWGKLLQRSYLLARLVWQMQMGNKMKIHCCPSYLKFPVPETNPTTWVAWRNINEKYTFEGRKKCLMKSTKGPWKFPTSNIIEHTLVPLQRDGIAWFGWFLARRRNLGDRQCHLTGHRVLLRSLSHLYELLQL